jgi:hypothetical protein
MVTSVWKFVRVVNAGVLVTILAGHPTLPAQTHVVSAAELQKEALAATRTREYNAETVTAFLTSPKAEKALQSAHMRPAQVTKAVAALSDQELAQLASRAEKAQADFAAGRLTDRDLLIILLGIAALVLIIVAVR